MDVYDFSGLLGSLLCRSCRVECGGNRFVQDRGGDVLDFNLHVHLRVVQDDVTGYVGGPGHDIRHRLVVGFISVVILTPDNDGVDAQVLGLCRRVDTDQDGRVGPVHGYAAFPRNHPLGVAVHVCPDILEAAPVGSYA